MKNYALYLSFATAMLLLASCRSSKHVAQESTDVQQSEVVTQPSVSTESGKETRAFTPPTDPNFTAKVKVNLKMSDKSVSTHGMLRMRYNDVIQLTLVDPILGIAEVGRMEISVDSMLVIDRMNKRYFTATYSDIPALGNMGIDFNAIQEKFWSEACAKDECSFNLPLSKPMTLNLTISDRGNSDNWEGHTSVSSKYTKVSTERLLRSIMQLTE